MNTFSWPPAPQFPALADREIHVWSAGLDVDAKTRGGLKAALTSEEHVRAARFRFERDRQRFTVARGILRDILSRYLHCRPAELAFSYGPHGKPALANDTTSLCFNVSHSGELALYAVSPGVEVGVDVERVEARNAGRDIAERFFAPREIAALGSLPSDLQVEAFFLCWTRKEAYIKAIGKGISIPLESFEVSLMPGQSAAILSGEPGWSIQPAGRSAPGAGIDGALLRQYRQCPKPFWFVSLPW